MLSSANAHGIAAMINANAAMDEGDGFSNLFREYVESLEARIVASMSESEEESVK